MSNKYLRFIILLILCSVFAKHSYAQDNIIVQEETSPLETTPGGIAFTVDISQAESQKVIRYWSRAIRQNTKNKVIEAGDEYYIIGTIIERIHKKPMNIYFKVLELQTSAKLITCFKIDDQFISEETLPEKAIVVRKFVREFAIEQYKEAVDTELARAQTQLNDLGKRLKKMIGLNKRLYKRIIDNEQAIEKARNDIKENELDKTRKQEIIQDTKDEISLITGNGARVKEERKELKGRLSKLETSFNKLERRTETNYKKINRLEVGIKEYELQIENNLEEQKELKILIAEQKAIVKLIGEKHRHIK